MMGKTTVFRPGATAGEWMNTLLPLAVLLQFSQTSFASGQCSPLTVGALGFAPFVAGTFLSRTWPGKSSMQNTFVCCVMSALSIFVFAKTGFLYSIAVGVITTFGFQHLVNTLLKSFPLSFTIGEACVVSQGLLLFIMSSVSNMLYSLHKNPSDCVGIATLILQVGLMGVGLICTAVWLVPALRVVVPFYAVVFIVAAGMVVPLLYFFLQLNPVLWIVQMLFEDQYTIALVFYWIACCMLAVIALSFQVKAGKHASTSIRKYFHVLAVAVFLPGLILRPCLLYLSSGVILALFIIFEVFRILQMPPLGVVLQDAYSIFVDEKDAGVLALTPIYLLVGCSVPVWLHPVVSQEALLQLVSGLLAVGIGDTAASVCGHNFGRHKWKGSMKTKEGTAASIVSQMSVLVILAKLGFLRSSGNEYCKMLIAVIISSIVEAKTEQVDNLCLPLITYILLNAPT